MSTSFQYDHVAQRIARILCEDDCPQALFEALARVLADVIPSERFSLGISLLNRWYVFEDGETRFRDFSSEGTIVEGKTASSWVLYKEQSLLRSDIEKEQRFPFDPELTADGWRSDLIIPLAIGGSTIGTANFTSRRVDALKPSHLEAAEGLADLLAVCAERVQERLERQTVQRVSQAIQSSNDLDEILRMILAHIQSQGYDRVRVYLLEPEGDVLRGAIQYGGDQPGAFSEVVFRLDEDPYSRETFRGNEPRIYATDTPLCRETWERLDHAVHAPSTDGEWAEIPLRGRDDLIVGKISLDNRRTGRPLSTAHLQALAPYVSQAAIAIQHARMYGDLEREVERRSARLTESQRRYRHLFENMQDGAAYHQIVVDGDGNPVDYVFLEANKAFEKLTGLKRSEIVGRRVTEVIPGLKDSEFDWIGTYGKVALTGGVRSFEQYAEPLNRWFDVSAYSPETGYFVAIFQDVSDRRDALAELQKSEEALRQRTRRQGALLRISNAVQSMTRPADLESVLLSCLEELRGLGVKAETMAVHRVVDPSEYRVHTFRVNRQGLIAPPETRRATALTRSWQEQRVLIMGDQVPAADFAAKFGGLDIRSCLDVPYSLGVVSVHTTEKDAYTERDEEDLKQVADIISFGLSRLADLEALEARTAELVESESKWRALVENATDIIMSVDRSGQILFINRPMPGLTIDGTIGTRLHDHADPADREAVDDVLERVFTDRATDEFETRFAGDHGESRAYLSRVSPVVRDGKVVSCHIISRDITSLKQTESELLKLERFRALGEMSAGVSHNLNNILTGVMGPAELLKLRTSDPEILAEADLIFRSATRARDLVRRLDRSVKGTPEEAVDVDVNGVVREAIEISRPRWKDEPEAMGRRIDIETELAVVPRITGTVSGLTDVVVNLILNAVDALPKGGTIRIATHREGGTVVLTFSDDGIGMDAITRDKVFDPFFTTKADVGTGLGLSTVYGSISRWGGTIDLQSSPGQGTTFTVRLPVHQGEAAPVLEGPRAGTNGRRVRVMAVEDEETVREVIERMVSTQHDIRTFPSGDRAIDAFEPGEFEVALIDLGMPDMPGDQVAERLRSADPDLVTILLSGWALEEDDPRARSFDLQMLKPVESMDAILGIVTQAVQIRDRRLTRT